MSIRVKTFFLIAATCFVVAIIAIFEAKKMYADAAMHRATMTQSVEKSDTLAVNADNNHLGEVLEVVSVCFAVLGIVFWVSSAVRKEQCRHSILIVLFVFFILSLFVIV